MNHPNGPYGPGFPGQQPGGQPMYPPPYPQKQPYPQPPYAQQQYAQPQYSQPPYPPHGYPPAQYPPPGQPPAQPSGVTGIIAGVLAGLGGIANVVGGAMMAFGLAAMTADASSATTDSVAWAGLTAITMLNVVAGVLLSVGAVLLFLRKPVSRWLVVAGCAVSMVSSMISFAMPAAFGEYEYSGKATDAFGLVFPIATLVLVLLPTTAAWLRATQRTVQTPPPPYYPPPYRG